MTLSTFLTIWYDLGLIGGFWCYVHIHYRNRNPDDYIYPVWFSTVVIAVLAFGGPACLFLMISHLVLKRVQK